MTDGLQQQRLAAILAADAVGYSRMMEADQRATVAALESARNVFRTQIEGNQGRVVNTAGDSVLALFDSAAGAVNAAIAVQRALGAAAKDVPPNRQLRFRIGVHLGDIISTADGDDHGDGVNIAARLQALAEPGGVLVSEAVRGAVKNRVEASFDDRGVQSVKNISDPIRAFAVRLARPAMPPVLPMSPETQTRRPSRLLWASAACVAIIAGVGVTMWMRGSGVPAAAAPAAQSSVASAGKPSIAVLPFANMSGEADQAYFADGITEDLITDLSKISGLFVIARNSTFAYKGKTHDLQQIAKTLGVHYVLDGSVRKSGEAIRVNAQLTDASSGAQVWGDRYDGDMKNIFGLQDTVARNVVKALSVKLTTEDDARVASRGTDNAQAYDVFLKGWERYLRQTPEDFREAIVDFKRATELDPNYARAYAALAAIHWESYTRFWGQAVERGTRNEDALGDAQQALAKAMRAPTPLAHQVASAMLLQSQQQDEAVLEAQRAIASDPNDANGYITLAGALSFVDKPTEAIAAVEHAMQLNPHYPSSYLYQLGLAQFAANRVEEAAATLERAIALNPDDYWSQRLLLSTYGLLRRRDDAARLLRAIKGKDQRGQYAFLDPPTINAMTYWYPFTGEGDAKRFADGLALAGVPP